MMFKIMKRLCNINTFKQHLKHRHPLNNTLEGNLLGLDREVQLWVALLKQIMRAQMIPLLLH